MKQQRRVATILGTILGTAFALLVAVAEGRAEVVEEFHHVYALSATGSVALKNVNGNVRISAWDRNEVKVDAVKRAGTKERLDSRMPSSRISLKSVNGVVELTIPSDANADVSAETVNGGIDNDFGLHVHHGQYVGHDLRGQIGNGGTHIDMSNVNGTIEIRHASDGKPVSPAKSFTRDDDEI